MPDPILYISRQEAEQLEGRFAQALSNPRDVPIIFQIWGIGGVGKTTLKNRLKQNHQKNADFVEVSFGVTPDILTAIDVMNQLYQQLPKTNILQKDLLGKQPFKELYQQYRETIHQLETQPSESKKAVDQAQIDAVKKLVGRGASAIASLTPGSPIPAPIAGQAAEAVIDYSTNILSVKDNLQELLQQHKATKKKRELQELMLNPLPKLTQAFVEELKQNKRPVILILDTYEKASQDIDFWLWQYLATELHQQRTCIKLILAGRHNLLKQEPWRKLQQDYNLISTYDLDRFDAEQTQAYLQQIGLTHERQVKKVFQITKGLPYYLNLIRNQRQQGETLDFFQFNEEIISLLLQGLNSTQKKVVQFVACCRSFDQPLVKFLINSQDNLDFDQAVAQNLNCFDWLKKLNFVESVQGSY